MFWMDEGGERLRQTEIEGYKNKEREREREMHTVGNRIAVRTFQQL